MTWMGPIRLIDDHRAPLLVGELFDGPPGRHTRNVHHDVHAAMTSVDVGAEASHLVVVGDVERAVLGHGATERAHVGNGRLQPRSVAVCEIQLRALDRQLQRRGTTDTARRARQKHPLACERLRHGRDPTGRSPVSGRPTTLRATTARVRARRASRHGRVRGR